MKVLILTPEKTVYQGEAFSLYACGLNGFFQVLDHHTPMISILKEGQISLRESREKETNQLYFLIKCGLLEVKNNTVIIMDD